MVARWRSPRRLAAGLGAGLAAMLLVGCSSTTATAPEDGRPSVVAAFYPLHYAATSVGGEAVHATSLTPAGVEPHDLELTAQQVAEIADADLVLYVRGFQPAVDEAVDQQAPDRALDLGSVVDRLADDPHIWLDPMNMAAIGSAVSERLAQIAPDDAETFTANATDLTTAMSSLDEAFATGLADCATRELVVSHEAFGYLAAAYDLNQVAISGLSPEAEPSPARLRDVAHLVTHDGITTIYYETLVDPKVATTIADETGATTAVLDPLEGLVDGSTGDYESIMRQNLATLIAGQKCP